MLKVPIAVLLLVSLLFSQGMYDWQTITDLNNVKDMVARGETVWAVSDGGLLKLETDQNQYQVFTNLQGLRSINLTTIAINDQGQIILGDMKGIIQIYDPQTQSWVYQYALQDNIIYDLFVQGDTLWVAAGKGVGVFIRNADQYVFKDYFRNFPIRPEAVLACAVFNQRIWIATNEGLLAARSDFGRFPINDPNRWQVYTTANKLPNNYVTTLLPNNDVLWIGTATGIGSADLNNKLTFHFNWQKDQSGAYLKVQSFLIQGDQLLVGSQNGVYQFTPQAGTQFLKAFPSEVQALAVTNSGNVWVGLNKNGLASLNDETVYKVNGPASNAIRSLIKDSRGNIWASSGRPKTYQGNGIFRFDGTTWQSFVFKGENLQRLNNTVVIYEDRFQNLWFGSWGGGAMCITASQADTVFFHNYGGSAQLEITDVNHTTLRDLQNATVYSGFFKGIPSNSKYEIISAIKEDPNGNLWFANYYASDSRYLAVAPYKGTFVDLDRQNWVYFGIEDGLSPEEGGVLCLEFDRFSNRVYIGTFNNGVYVLDYGSSIFDKTDDKMYKLTIQDNLFSNTVLSLAMDEDGVLWIGTAAGLNSFDGINVYKHVGDERGLSGPLENEIHFIWVDRYNNKWLATNGGLSILRGDRSPWDGSAWMGLNSQNSFLIDDNVQCLFVDSENSQAFVGTENGLSLYRGAFAEIKETYEQLKAGPNPFILENGNEKFVIKNLLFNSSVKILNINGALVRHLTPKTVLSDGTVAVDGGRAYWDGRDESGARVASGVYLYFAYSENGKSVAGKIAVIRK